MKRSVFILVALLGCLLLSCKKDWTCQCTKIKNGNAMGVQHYPIENKTKEDAKSACKKLEESYVNAVKAECTLP